MVRCLAFKLSEIGMTSAKDVGFLKILGAVLLIIGTSIGGGMLALPIATAYLGFVPSATYLLITWMLMTCGALLILEVNAWLPLGSNLISMAGATVGKIGQGLAWIAYLLLLYGLLSAYVAGGQDVVTTIFSYVGVELSNQLSAFIFTLFFSLIVYTGIRQVDWVNRLVMLIKLVTYLSMVVFTLPFVKMSFLVSGPIHFSVTLSTVMIMITSYGFAIIVPSLRAYFHNNIKALRRAVIIGSFIPLIFYLIWEGVIFGALPKTGEYSLHALATSSQPISTLMGVLSHLSQHSWLVWVANVFTSVCVITAFLGVSLCMIDFLADGFRVKKTGKSGFVIYLATFIPPLLLALFATRVFVYGLSFAGIFCVYLLILLPAWMAWWGRYKHKFPDQYRLFGGKPLLIILIVMSIALLLVEIIQRIIAAF
jgi:tyrosine-specific transport protein